MVYIYCIFSYSETFFAHIVNIVQGATDGGMGQHIEALSNDELTIFGKVCFQAHQDNSDVRFA